MFNFIAIRNIEYVVMLLNVTANIMFDHYNIYIAYVAKQRYQGTFRCSTSFMFKYLIHLKFIKIQ